MDVHGNILHVFVFYILPSYLLREYIETVLGRPDAGQHKLRADDIAVRPYCCVESVVSEQSTPEPRKIFQTLERISGLNTLFLYHTIYIILYLYHT
jgi:hypothetical protein